MAKAGFLSKKSGFMMMDTETSNGFGSDKGSTQRNGVDSGFCGLGLQPFSTASAFKSPVGMAAACLRYPFTTAQWQELERQALIFKYMMASIPVPPDLLIPTARNLSSSASAAYPSLTRSWFANGTDPEPGRCRRTDGKKWRCSRDVAPDQKYCERHMHRSRPRSRKHVEVQTEINNSTNTSTTMPPATHSANSTSRQSSARPYPQPSLSLYKPDFKSLPLDTLAGTSSYKDSRCMDWMLKGDSTPLSNRDLQQLMQGKGNLETNNTYFPQRYQESNNLNSYTDFSTNFQGLETQHQNDDCCLFLNPELESLSDQRQMPRRFIDAWSTASDSTTRTNKSSVNGSGKVSPSTLSLSMSSDNAVGEDMDQVQMGLGVIDSECDNTSGSKSQPLSWMTPVSWVASPPGGPLGEVLQSSTTISQVGSACPSSICNNISRSSSSGGGLNLMTEDWGGSRDTSPRATTMSSPSGVLHKTLASPSDSSGGNSPTYKAAARTEIALQWMNHKK